jgi:hypothetical protein
MPEQYPVFIAVRDRVESLSALIQWLESVGQNEIWLIDNASTFPPLLEYLEKTPHHVVRTWRNLGHRSPWLSGMVQRHARGRHFIVSDPDVVPDETCPSDAIDHFRSLLDKYPDIDKVGFGLRIDDLPAHYPLREDVIDWELPFWQTQREPGVFQAGIDTTFALYRPLDRRHNMMQSLRTGPPYLARHIPWYVNAANLSAEDHHYREHADRTLSNWDRDVLPWWKQRRLGPLES